MLDVASPKRFQILRKLGEGGMGVVYEAHDEERGARVALKMIRNLTPTSIARFKREFRALADVHHPNLISLGELVSEGDTWFFTMELVEGKDFIEYVRVARARSAAYRDSDDAPTSSERSAANAPTLNEARPGGDFDELRLRSSLVQLASALEALHTGGIAHRDVKPSNIRVTPGGRVVLLDFGLTADFTQAHPVTQAQMSGTPAYMAPEQAASGALGPAVDWYAVGVLLFEALTGRLPFEGNPLVVMMGKQQDGPAPTTIAPDVPADLDALCASLLRFDPKTRATGVDVMRVVGADGGSRRSLMNSHTEAPPFVGRAEEMALLREAFEDSQKKREAITVLLEGESGVGKSCLARSFVETLGLEMRDLVILAGRCFEREAVPYKALDGVVDSLTRFLMREGAAVGAFMPVRAGPLAQIFPVLRRVEAFASALRQQTETVDPLAVRSRAFEALREILTRLGQRRPLVVVIDDLQWSDADGFALLAEVLRPPEAPAMLFIGTVRVSPAGEGDTSVANGGALRELANAFPAYTRHVPLSRLSAEDAQDLAARLLQRTVGTNAAPTAEAIAREANGHPLFIDALVRHAAFVGGGVTAGRLEEALWSSVASQEAGARRIIETLAVASAPVTQEVLVTAADVPPDAFGRHLARLRVAHLISATGGRAADTVEPYHDRIRAAVLRHLDAPMVAERHLALARALERTRSQDAEALALHWRGAGDVNQASKYALQAAEAAAGALAFDRAAKLYETALELRPLAGAEQSALLEKLGDALANAGRGKRAAEVYADAARGAQAAARSLDLRRRSADHLLRSGHVEEGLAAMARVLAAIGLKLPRSVLSAALVFIAYRAYLRVRGLGFRVRDASEIAATELTRVDTCWSLAFGLGTADNIRGAAFQAYNLILALRSGERYRVARAVAIEVAYVSRRGGPAVRRSQALLERAHSLAAASGEPHAMAWVQVASSMSYHLTGRWKRALEHMEQAKGLLAAIPGAVWEQDTMVIFSTNVRVLLGQIGHVVRETPKAVRDARMKGDLYAAVNLRIGDANIVWLAADEPALALADIDEAMSQWSKRDFHIEHFYEFLARTNALLYGGRAREAHAYVGARWPALRRSLLPLTIQNVRLFTLNLRARAALAAAETGVTGRASILRDAARAARRIEREKMAFAMPWAKLLRAGVAKMEGRKGTERVVSLLREAVSGFDAADMALYAVAARRTLGKIVGGDEGRALVSGADAWMISESIKNPARMTAMLAPGFGNAD